ncbi:helix-turn-helix domain-containing protein [Flavobacteriaceae bacterium R38]|nr:helix-turn-helix domain-containing protein [Flavobacteriaceae bacterium R38]
MNLDIWSIVILIIFFQGLFLLSILLLSAAKKKRKGSSFLIAIVIVLLWFLAEFFCIRNTIDVNFDLFYGTRYGSWFLLGPLVYFYTKSITSTQRTFSTKSFLHFIPFIVFVIIIPLSGGNILDQRQVHYGMLSVFDHRDKVISPIQYTYSILFITQFLHFGFYLLRNLMLLRKYKQDLALAYSNIGTHLKWTRIFNILLLFTLIFDAIFLYILLVTDIYRRHLDYIYVLPMGVLFYLISFYLINTEWQSIDKKVIKYANSSLTIENMAIHIEKLNELMEKKKIHLNNELRLHDLAQEMNLKNHHLSQIINQHFKLSFFDFINQYRVNEAKKIIQEHPEYTLIQVAFDAGFNNKTSFVNAFKKFEKITPSKFRESTIQV